MVFWNKKAVTESLSVLAIVLIMSILASAVFYWYMSVDTSSKLTTEEYADALQNRMSTSLSIVSEFYNNYTLSIFVENQGMTIVPITDGLSISLFKDNQIICVRDYRTIDCVSGCESDLEPGRMRRIDILLNKDCDISEYSGFIKYRLDFGGVVGVASEFKK